MSMIDSNKDMQIVKHSCQLAKSHGFKLIAEGVENKETIDMLRTFGVDIA